MGEPTRGLAPGLQGVADRCRVSCVPRADLGRNAALSRANAHPLRGCLPLLPAPTAARRSSSSWARCTGCCRSPRAGWRQARPESLCNARALRPAARLPASARHNARPPAVPPAAACPAPLQVYLEVVEVQREETVRCLDYSRIRQWGLLGCARGQGGRGRQRGEPVAAAVVAMRPQCSRCATPSGQPQQRCPAAGLARGFLTCSLAASWLPLRTLAQRPAGPLLRAPRPGVAGPAAGAASAARALGGADAGGGGGAGW